MPSVLSQTRSLPLTRLLELNEPVVQRHDILKQQHFVKLSQMSRGNVFGLEDGVFGG